MNTRDQIKLAALESIITATSLDRDEMLIGKKKIPLKTLSEVAHLSKKERKKRKKMRRQNKRKRS